VAKLAEAAFGLVGGAVAVTAATGPTSLGCATGIDATHFGMSNVEAGGSLHGTGATDEPAANDGALNAVAAADSGGVSDATETGETAETGGSGDAADVVPASDVGAQLDAGAGGDAEAATATDADGGWTADADAASPCDTASILFADAGSGGHTLLFAFDQGAGASNWIGIWDRDPTGAAAPIAVDGVTDAGHSCPGALRATFAFSTYAQQGEVQYNYNPPPSHHAGHKVHMWVKLVVSGGGYSNFNDLLAPVTQWTTGAPSTRTGNYPDQSPQTFADGNWHECIAPLGPTDAGEVTLDFQQLAAYLISQWTDAGPPPTAAVLYLDDIWLQ
jgi:hypothetical protein